MPLLSRLLVYKCDKYNELTGTLQEAIFTIDLTASSSALMAWYTLSLNPYFGTTSLRQSGPECAAKARDTASPSMSLSTEENDHAHENENPHDMAFIEQFH